jgi:hypothetical protein
VPTESLSCGFGSAVLRAGVIYVESRDVIIFSHKLQFCVGTVKLQITNLTDHVCASSERASSVEEIDKSACIHTLTELRRTTSECKWSVFRPKWEWALGLSNLVCGEALVSTCSSIY